MSIPRLAAVISFIDDDLLTEAITYSPARRDLFKTLCFRTSLAACACLVVSVILWAIRTAPSDGPMLSYPIETNPLQIEEIQSDAPNIMDMQINEISPNYFVPEGMLALIGENFEMMDRDEVLNHFGVSFDLSTVLPNMQEIEDTCYGFYHFEDGSIFNQFTFKYVDLEAHQTMDITLRNGGLPISMINEAYKHGMQKSMIYDKEVMIAHYADFAGISTYYAEFSEGDLGVMIRAGGCSIEDFIRTLEYLVQS